MRIYISHATEDSEAAQRLARELRDAGHESWLAESGILPGDNRGEAIGRASPRSEAMVVLLTPAALRSRWVRQEITYALGNERFEGRLIPVVIGEANELPKDDVPWILQSFLWLSVEAGAEDRAADQIAEALSPTLA